MERRFSVDRLASMREFAMRGRLSQARVVAPDEYPAEGQVLRPLREVHELRAALNEAIDEIERLYDAAGEPPMRFTTS